MYPRFCPLGNSKSQLPLLCSDQRANGFFSFFEWQHTHKNCWDECPGSHANATGVIASSRAGRPNQV